MPVRARNLVLLTGVLGLLGCWRTTPPPEVVESGPPCEPSSCTALGVGCGQAPDGCGGVLDCGECEKPQTCTPVTCAGAGAACGALPDGCGGMLSCGSCGEGQVCGGPGQANVCVPAGAPPPAWFRALPNRVTALTTGPDENVRIIGWNGTAAAPGKLDRDGNVLGWGDSAPSEAWLNGLAVMPGSGELYAWGWTAQGGGWGGSSIAMRYDAQGRSPWILSFGGRDTSEGPYVTDRAGTVAWMSRSVSGGFLRYQRADERSWGASYVNPPYTDPEAQPLIFRSVGLAEVTGDLLLGALLHGTGTAFDHPFGREGGSNLIVLALTPEKRLRWVSEMPVQGLAYCRQFVSAPDGTVTFLGQVEGALTLGDTRIVSKGYPHPQFLASYGLDGTLRWVRVLPFSTRDVFLAVSPSGHLAVAGSEPAPSDGCPRYRERVRVAELDPSGTLLWNSILGSETCPGSMDVAGLGYSGEGVVLGGSAEGKVNVGAGAPVDVGSEPSGYVVKLRPRR